MEARKRSGAVVAGLMGASTWALPQTAYALDIPGSRMGPTSEVLFAFLIGCSAGATAVLIAQISELTRTLNRAYALEDRLRESAAEQSAVFEALRVPAYEDVPAAEPNAYEPVDEAVIEPRPAASASRSQLLSSLPFVDAEPERAAGIEEGNVETAAEVLSYLEDAASAAEAAPASEQAGPSETGPVMTEASAVFAAVVDALMANRAQIEEEAARRAQDTLARTPDPAFVEKWNTGIMKAVGLDVVPETVEAENVNPAAGMGPQAPESIVFSTVASYVDESDIESATPSPSYVNVVTPYDMFASDVSEEKSAAPKAVVPAWEDEEPEAPFVQKRVPSQKHAASHARATAAPKRPEEPTPEAQAAFTAYEETYKSVTEQIGVEYERVALEYADKKRNAGGAAARLKGVAAVLQGRLGKDRGMDGVPVISRADGTVADVGTSWWNEAVGEYVSSSLEDTGSLPDVVDMGSQVMAERAAVIAARIAALDKSISFEMPRTYAEEAESPNRSDLASVLPELDGLAPEGNAPAHEREVRRGSHFKAQAEPARAEGSKEAVWAAALDALNEDGQAAERSTGVISGRERLEQPDFSDTASYVEFLIEDEFLKSTSAAARQRVYDGSVRENLRVMLGGTGGWRATGSAEEREDEFEWQVAQEA